MKLTQNQIQNCQHFTDTITPANARRLGKALGLPVYITGHNYLTLDGSHSPTTITNLAIAAARFIASNFTAVMVHCRQGFTVIVAGGKLHKL